MERLCSIPGFQSVQPMWVSSVCLMQDNCSGSHKWIGKSLTIGTQLPCKGKYLRDSTSCSGQEDAVSKCRREGANWVSPEEWVGFYKADMRGILLVTCPTLVLVRNIYFICFLEIQNSHFISQDKKRGSILFVQYFFTEFLCVAKLTLMSWSLSEFS